MIIVFIYILLIISILSSFYFIIIGKTHIVKAVTITILSRNYGPSIYDFRFFRKNKIYASKQHKKISHSSSQKLALTQNLIDYNLKFKTTGLQIIKGNNILFEEYYLGANDKTIINSFSIAKTVLSFLVGIAILENKINSLDDNISDYLPEYEKYRSRNITIKHLLNMTSGFDWVDRYSIKETFLRIYYGNNVNDFLLKRGFKHLPGKKFKYSSGSTQLVSIILSRVISCSISEYATEKLWKPMGMTSDAYWFVDNTGFEKTFTGLCCNLNALTKIGILLKNGGSYEGQQIVPKSFIDAMIMRNANSYSGFDAVWIDYKNEHPKFYLTSGYKGQYIIVIPEHDLIITRTGKEHDRDIDFKKGVYFPSDIYFIIEEVLAALNSKNSIPKKPSQEGIN